MHQKTRILLFTTAYKPLIGGSEIAIEQITRRLPDVFFDIVTPRYKRKFKKQECSENVCIHRLGLGWAGDKFLFPIAGLIFALGLSKRHRYGLIHAYQASYGAGAAYMLKLIFPGTQFILTLQEGKDLEKQNFLLKFIRRLIIKKADTITVISNYLKKYAQGLNKGAEILVIPNGVDVEKFRIQNLEYRIKELKGELNIEKDDKVIITVSRLVPKNGLENLIKAISMLNAKLLIIGAGPLEKKLKSKIQDLKLRDKILMLGKIPYDQIPEYLLMADVFVRPSLSEGLGNAFLEALAAGVPIIGTSVGGIPDFLKDGETGLFCEVNNPEDLVDKIKKILTNGELREKIIKNAQRLVSEKYNWDNIAQQFKFLYERQY